MDLKNKMDQLGNQFEEMGKTMGDIRDRIPHIVVGKDKNNYVEDPFVTKVKRWLLIVLTILVIGVTATMVIPKILTRLFG